MAAPHPGAVVAPEEPPEPRPAFASLAVSGFPDAIVALPADRAPHSPVVIVVHGLCDRPERHCEAWRNMTSARAFIVCPRGAYAPERSWPGHTRYTHPFGAPLRRHIDAALTALAERFGDDVDVAFPLIAGFSLGASEVALLALSDPARFPRVVLLEGGLDVWSDATIRAFASGGGKRVLFGCGSAWCTPPAKAATSRIERGGVEARVVSTPVGHTMEEPLQQAVSGELPWLVDGEPPAARPFEAQNLPTIPTPTGPTTGASDSGGNGRR